MTNMLKKFGWWRDVLGLALSSVVPPTGTATQDRDQRYEQDDPPIEQLKAQTPAEKGRKRGRGTEESGNRRSTQTPSKWRLRFQASSGDPWVTDAFEWRPEVGLARPPNAG
jgi:hypothetical protein